MNVTYDANTWVPFWVINTYTNKRRLELWNPDTSVRCFDYEELESIDYWSGEHPDYPREDWRNEVVDCNTLLGYWHWAESQESSELEFEKQSEEVS
jgi:hypothetical protein